MSFEWCYKLNRKGFLNIYSTLAQSGDFFEWCHKLNKRGFHNRYSALAQPDVEPSNGIAAATHPYQKCIKSIDQSDLSENAQIYFHQSDCTHDHLETRSNNVRCNVQPTPSWKQ